MSFTAPLSTRSQRGLRLVNRVDAVVPRMPNSDYRTAYRVEVAGDWTSVPEAWGIREGASTPFQQPSWLAAWYATMARRPDVDPLVVRLSDGRGETAMVLPLVRRRAAGLRLIEFADLGLSDYNGPILGPAAPRTQAGARRLWRSLRRALPPADIVRLRKMPVVIGGRPNPLALLGRAARSAVNGNVVEVGNDWEAYRYSRARPVRRELERSWRVFTRHPDAAFRPITEPAEALRVLAVMEAQQSARMHAKGADYALDDPAVAGFYRALVQHGIGNGFAVLTVLEAGAEIVAALLGIRHADSYIMVRISNAGGEWSTCSPGRLVIEQTMAWLHAHGMRRFDFSVGNYDYKRRFEVVPVPLVDLTAVRGWRGLPIAARAAAAAMLRDRPMADRVMRRAFGRLAADV